MKGSILIVEDRPDEKIGSFTDYLTKAGYTIILADTLEDAIKKMNDLLTSNNIDGVILDFSFPTNKEDPSVSSDELPNGIVFLDKFTFQLNTKQIPVIINTTADKEYKERYLQSRNLDMPLFNVNHESNPLASSTPQATQAILKLFYDRTESRNRNIIPASSWPKRGGPFIRGPHGEILGYR